MTGQPQTRQTAVKNTAPQDPRIDSPEVRVIYPSPEAVPSPVINTQAAEPTAQPVGQTTPAVQLPTPEMEKRPAEKTEVHTCKVDLQQAIKQNLVAFVGLVLLAIGLGYLIGKNRP